ncbi:MAG TPA: aminotransferase class I/II-fold pyridoxal phosphate-dependent enzyme, partial [Hanamia sp.]|nr:aminotransferase class I/II-fold pyridoxal phosphate-dependent enzyme [Hanamia sp.]
PPYNINASSQQLTLEALKNTGQVNEWIKEIVDQRNSIKQELSLFPFVEKIYESDANFLLVKVEDADSLYQYLRNKKIVVRSRSKEVLCENCIRITIGTMEENKVLLEAFKNYNS